MKKYSILFLIPLFVLLLSSCSMHLGLSKIFKSGSAQPTKTKHIKATHTPPSPPTATPAGAGALLATPHAGNAILITSAGEQPNSLQVKVGSPVTWVNTDDAAHTVTSDTAGVFDSGPINSEASFTFVFTQPGTFAYHSASGSGYTGTIVVTQ